LHFEFDETRRLIGTLWPAHVGQKRVLANGRFAAVHLKPVTSENPHAMHRAFKNLAVARFLALLLGLMLAEGATAHAKHLPTGDVDCDGHADAISYSVSPDTVRVEVRFSQKGRAAQSLTFSIGADSENSLRVAPAEVSLESLDFDLSAEEMGDLPGFQRSKLCKGIVLDDQQSDPIHVYWDHDAHRLAWWHH
jgi:hypothetical protein